MNILSSDINKTRRKITVSFDSSEICSEETSLLKEFSKAAKIPGFRPGKVPESLIRKRFSKEIADELKRKITSSAYKEALGAIEEEVLTVVEMDKVSLLSGKGTEIGITFDIIPSFLALTLSQFSIIRNHFWSRWFSLRILALVLLEFKRSLIVLCKQEISDRIFTYL